MGAGGSSPPSSTPPGSAPTGDNAASDDDPVERADNGPPTVAAPPLSTASGKHALSTSFAEAMSSDGGVAFGRYRLIEPLGRGGMAEVFKAKSFGVEGFEKVLVIKRIVPELAEHQEFVEMFVREAKLAVRLSHANIVQVFDLGRIDGDDAASSYFIAMEYVAGVDLASMLAHQRKQKAKLALGLCAFVVAEVAKALDHAHRRHDERGRALGIVHRDISPHNILLSWDGDVKVTDFGIAKAADTIAREEEPNELEAAKATGKIPFMSPEQSRSERTDARSDLFSLGSVLYEMITGANPFRAPTIGETIRRIGAGEYPPVSLGRPDVPTELVLVLDKLLAVDPNDRFASAAEACEHLIAYGYTSGERFSASDLAQALSELRDSSDTLGEALEPASVFDEPLGGQDRTPIEVPHHATPPVASQIPPETGERREITMLVVNLGSRSDDGTGDVLGTRIRDLLERHGAWVEEITTTQLVALFGLGATDGRDAEAAVRAALVVVRERTHDAEDATRGTLPSAAAHSGSLNVDVGGIPITDERFASLQTTTQGLARAAEGRVVISGQTARLVRRAFITEALTESARNAVGSGKVVVGALPEIDQGKFIGRRKALRLLGSLLAAATRLEPQIVVVRGETGLGKTRLLAEAQRRLRHGDFNLALYTASCPLNGASVPWSALSAMLHVLCGTQEDDDPNRIREVRPRLRALGLNDEQSEAVLGLLGAPQTVLPRETRSLLRASLERMVLSLCRDRLHCFAWDDAQAIDRETLDALLRIVRRQKRLRGVFILAQRGEVPARLLKVKGTHLLELEELSERDTKRLIAARLGARSVPQELLEFVRAAAGGHPLFVEELVRELCDTAAIQVMNGNVTMKSDCHATAPRTLRNLIADRVSRLPQRERRVLQGIAILGEPAYTPVLASVLDRPLPTLDHSLTNLVARNLVRRTGATRVRLASPLYRDIVVDAMPDTAQRDLHARAANTYEESDVRSVGDAAERIANHWLAAGEQSRSVDLFWQSAHERLASGQLEHAMRSMLRGAELADMASRSVEQLAKWLADIAQTASQVRQGPGLKDAVSAAVREVETRGSQEQRTHAYIHLARALGSVNLFDEAFEALATSRYEDVDDVRLKREALSATVELALRKGLFREAATASDRLEQLGALDDERALLVMAVARAGTGDTEAALSHLDRVDKLSKPKNAAEAVLRQKQRVLIHFNARNFETAADEATKLTSMAREAGLRFDTAAALHNLGDACYRLGDHPRAYAALVESLEISRTLEHERLTALNQMHLCLLDGLRGNDDAEQRLKSLIRYADGRGYLWDVLEGRYLYACLLVHKGKGEQARRHLQDVITMSDEHGHTLIGINAREQLEQL